MTARIAFPNLPTKCGWWRRLYDQPHVTVIRYGQAAIGAVLALLTMGVLFLARRREAG